jgi:hypothetical protein
MLSAANNRSAYIDRPSAVLRIRDELRYRLHFRKGRSTKSANTLKLNHFLNAPS